MQVQLKVAPYSRTSGLSYEWDDGFEIAVSVDSDDVVSSANAAGLTSLARHRLTLAQSAAPDGSHLHLTAGQEIDSPIGLILERVPER